jgi:Raf kinase inhibitor-like YbhB/YbcL family protein
LIVEDPDAPKMTWAHWVAYNIPATATGLPEGATGLSSETNDWKCSDYGGPYPPIGCHCHFFKLYAMDIVLPDTSHPGKPVLEQAMQEHITEQAAMIGTCRCNHKRLTHVAFFCDLHPGITCLHKSCVLHGNMISIHF